MCDFNCHIFIISLHSSAGKDVTIEIFYISILKCYEVKYWGAYLV